MLAPRCSDEVSCTSFMLMTYKHVFTSLVPFRIDGPFKTQFISLDDPKQLAGVAETFPHVTFSTTVHDLGVTLDQELSVSQHVNLVTQSRHYQLSQLRVIMHFLSHDAAVSGVQRFLEARG